MLNQRPKYIKVRGSLYQKVAHDEPVPLPASEAVPMDPAEFQRLVKDVVLKVDEQLTKLDDVIAAAEEAGVSPEKMFSLRVYVTNISKEQNAVGAEYGLF